MQTMRSWSTLQPGEAFSCVGCHESQNSAPLAGSALTQAIVEGPQPLSPFYGPPRGFSFAKEIQPILNKHCIDCHWNRNPIVRVSDQDSAEPKAFSLLGETVPDRQAKRRWSDAYLILTQSVPEGSGRAYQGDPDGRWVRWISAQSEPTMLPPYSSGATRSPLLQLLESGHEGVVLSTEEHHKLAAWIDLLVPYCGDYTESNLWTEAEQKKYAHFLEKRLRMHRLEMQNIVDYLADQADRK